MRAVVVTGHGGSEVLETREEAEPAAGEGQLLVDIEAAGVNFRDVYEREGGYARDAPFVAGVEGAGTVAEVGSGVRGIAPGDRVGWVLAPGSFAERAVVDADNAVPVPDGISVELAGAVLLQGMTAHYLALDTHPVRAGDTVVVHAAAGGVGLLLTQIVKLRGGRVIATTSGGEKAELARGAGADEVIGYEGFAQHAREVTDGEGVAAIYDGVGRATFDEGLTALRPRGTMVLYGSASGAPDPLVLQRLAGSGSLYVTRPTLVHYTLTREEVLRRAEDLFGWIAAGELDVRIGGRYALEEARQAFDDLEGRRTTGKLVLLP
jgi:NADPH:quinone reductase